MLDVNSTDVALPEFVEGSGGGGRAAVKRPAKRTAAKRGVRKAVSVGFRGTGRNAGVRLSPPRKRAAVKVPVKRAAKATKVIKKVRRR
jgi:hypothetical protein